MKNLYESFNKLCTMVVAPLANLWARIFVGLIFFRSGQAKLVDFEETIELFDPEEDGEFALSFLSAEPAAYLATAGELILPVLLILGLFTRVGAAGLLVMTGVILIFIDNPPAIAAQEYLWLMILALLVGYGGNKISLDNWLLKFKNP